MTSDLNHGESTIFSIDCNSENEAVELDSRRKRVKKINQFSPDFTVTGENSNNSHDFIYSNFASTLDVCTTDKSFSQKFIFTKAFTKVENLKNVISIFCCFTEETDSLIKSLDDSIKAIKSPFYLIDQEWINQLEKCLFDSNDLGIYPKETSFMEISKIIQCRELCTKNIMKKLKDIIEKDSKSIESIGLIDHTTWEILTEKFGLEGPIFMTELSIDNSIYIPLLNLKEVTISAPNDSVVSNLEADIHYTALKIDFSSLFSGLETLSSINTDSIPPSYIDVTLENILKLFNSFDVQYSYHNSDKHTDSISTISDNSNFFPIESQSNQIDNFHQDEYNSIYHNSYITEKNSTLADELYSKLEVISNNASFDSQYQILYSPNSNKSDLSFSGDYEHIVNNDELDPKQDLMGSDNDTDIWSSLAGNLILNSDTETEIENNCESTNVNSLKSSCNNSFSGSYSKSNTINEHSPSPLHTPLHDVIPSVGVCGLSNLGNTCFMNSSFQCLSNTWQLTEYFLSETFTQEINKENNLGTRGSLATAYGSLLSELWKGSSRSYAPRNIKRIVGRFAQQFAGYQQQDAPEFLSFFLDGLHEDLNRIYDKPYIEIPDSNNRPDSVVADEQWEIYKKRNDSVIVDLFQDVKKVISQVTSSNFEEILICEVYMGRIYRILDDSEPISELDQDENFCAYILPFSVSKSIPQDKVAVKFLFSESKPKHESVPISMINRNNTPKLLGIPIVKKLTQDDSFKTLDGSEGIIIKLGTIYIELAKSLSQFIKPETAQLFSSLVDFIESLLSTSNQVDDSSDNFDCAISKFNNVFSLISKIITIRIKKSEKFKNSGPSFLNAGAGRRLGDIGHSYSSPAIMNSQQAKDGYSKTTNKITQKTMFKIFEKPINILNTELIHGGKIDDINALNTESEAMGNSNSEIQGKTESIELNETATSIGLTDTNRSNEPSELLESIIISTQDSEENETSLKSNYINNLSIINKLVSINNGDILLFEWSEEEFFELVNETQKLRDDSGDSSINFDTSLNGFFEWNYFPNFEASLDPSNNASNESIKVESKNELNTGKFISKLPLVPLVSVLDEEKWKCIINYRDTSNSLYSQPDKSKPVTLYECFNEFVTEEQLGEQDSWYCSECKDFRQATKKLDLWRLPEILVIHLKRFDHSRQWSNKINTLVDFPLEGLDLSEFFLAQSSENTAGGDSTSLNPPIYDLYATSNHFGGLGGGHYTAFARHPINNNWYDYNDSSVTLINDPSSEVVSSSAYVLFYRLRSKSFSNNDSPVDTNSLSLWSVSNDSFKVDAPYCWPSESMIKFNTPATNKIAKLIIDSKDKIICKKNDPLTHQNSLTINNNISLNKLSSSNSDNTSIFNTNINDHSGEISPEFSKNTFRSKSELLGWVKGTSDIDNFEVFGKDTNYYANSQTVKPSNLDPEFKFTSNSPLNENPNIGSYQNSLVHAESLKSDDLSPQGIEREEYVKSIMDTLEQAIPIKKTESSISIDIELQSSYLKQNNHSSISPLFEIGSSSVISVSKSAGDDYNPLFSYPGSRSLPRTRTHLDSKILSRSVSRTQSSLCLEAATIILTSENAKSKSADREIGESKQS
ncbi:Ubiquitin carboxyl-terminal hydrolase 4 [Smittium culicis]|uniref:ubiquitinyl hydrolase 1 n=1 Tax=Smittium culicis TaxID=133412 RepID=A0A1R1YB81_9FUNG|nr:Ubiquitin carboxyl-terminal hydrolase 4 [Smittium culicis]